MEVLSLHGIDKSFSHVKVLHGVDFSLEEGEIHALIGENGAGKSTLMKIIMGEHQPDRGEVRLRGKPVRIGGAKDALNRGVSMIHQELSSIPYMTVAENIYVGREPARAGFVNRGKLEAQCRELLEYLGIGLDARQRVGKLSVAEQQMLEIAKAVSYDSRVIIMDEPTSSLAEAEVQVLFDIIRLLKEKGIAVIYISHKLDELFAISDRITVLRDGRIISTRRTDEVDDNTLITEMVGREIATRYPAVEKQIGDERLRVEGLGKKGVFEDVSFTLREGEILGFSGLIGSGRTEVVSALFGLLPPDAGRVFLNGEPVRIRSPKQAMRHRMALVPEDRKLCGLNLVAPVRDNIVYTILGKLSRFGFVRRRLVRSTARRMIEELGIRVSSPDQLTRSLSGGNQQKIVLAKWLLTEPDIVLLDEPTRGIDVGAKVEIYRLIGELAARGKSVILVSSELPEIIGMSDRVAVLNEGRLMGVLDKEDLSQQRIMELISKGA